MEVHWTVHIPQAMQRHTGSVFAKPVIAERNDEKADRKEQERVPAEGREPITPAARPSSP